MAKIAETLQSLPAPNASIMAATNTDYAVDGLTRGEQIAAILNPETRAQLSRLYRKAAVKGFVPAQYRLGVMYRQGLGIPRDDAAALSWFLKTAQAGFAPAQFNLGLMYHLGEGTEQNSVLAATWYSKAADQGIIDAQTNLGSSYLNGQGVKQDCAAAAKLFLAAAENGDAIAQFNLGLLYAEGAGVQRNLMEAYKWIEVSASGPNSLGADFATNTKVKGMLAKEMTAVQIAESERQAKGWKKKG